MNLEHIPKESATVSAGDYSEYSKRWWFQVQIKKKKKKNEQIK